MKKKLAAFVSACLALACLAGCGTVPQSTTPTAPAPARTTPTAPMEPATRTPGEVTILLPTGREDIARILADIGAEDGITVRMTTKPAGSTYTAALQQALEGETPPELYWVEGTAQDAVLEEAGLMADLMAPGQSPSVAALASMVPQESRLLREKQVLGLPLGYTAQGYLVNIELLAALLGAEDIVTLARDLYACTARQWQYLVETLQAYLQSPARIQLKIADNTYTTPAYRPAAARPLRGMFAVPEREEGPFVAAALNAAVNAAFADRDDWEALSSQEKSARLAQVLPALLALFDLETLYMGTEESAVWRGEDFPNRARPGLQEATALLEGGSVLMLRCDSRTALAMETGPLAGKLALLPIKLQVPQTMEDEEEAQDTSEAEAEEDPNEDNYDADDAAAAMAENGERLAYATDGYLCLTPGAAGRTHAENLLLRLYTTPAGTNAITGRLGLYPFTGAMPQGLIQQQLWQAALGGKGRLSVLPASLSEKAEAPMGKLLYDSMMPAAEWDAALQQSFYSACYAALGLPYEYIPVEEAGM